MQEKLKRLREKAMKLPLEPGVYLMKSKDGEIIYIGKAKALKNRVSSYFGSQNTHPEKVRRMVENADDFNYIITDSEFEALMLECSLIKQYQPHYNILLKDDKGYSYVKITGEQWPRIKESKNKEKDGAVYIGPYTSSFYVKNAVDGARKIFRLPTCTRRFPEDFGKARPCLNFYIKQCMAPCTGRVKHSEYMEAVNDAIDFLKGGDNSSVKLLKEQMEEASERLEFERAAKLRDRINAINKVRQKQKVVAKNVKNQDVIALAVEDKSGAFEVFRFENGSLTDREDFYISDIGQEAKARSEFILQYYTIREAIPRQVTVDGEVEDKETIESWLSEKAGHKVSLVIPQRGEQLKLVQMCKSNAKERISQRKGLTGKQSSVLEELAQMLGLNKTPLYIEAYDISNLAGTENVAGMVVFENAKPLKKAYKRFKIKGFEGQDDYASMAEVITRRLDRYEQEKDTGKGFGRLPDLILLDGGKGHVGTILPIIKEKGYNIPVYGMVKDDKHKTRAITAQGEEIEITYKRSVFTLISTIQDEVHRFAITYHRKSRSKAVFKSSLTDIEGIGPTRAKNMLKYFGTIDKIKRAEISELENAPGMNKTAAENVYNYYNSEE